MSNVFRIARKELASFFSSLAAFIFMGVFLTALLFIFFWVERFFARDVADVRPLFEWMPILLIFLVSAMTMRMWSEERRAGTLEFLMTTPVQPVHLVLGKFLACLLLIAIVLLLTLPLPLTVSLIGPLDWGPVFGGYLATLALAAAYISIGLFVSARTDNQIVSLIVTVLICGIFYLLGSDALTSLFGNAGSEILRLIGSGSRFESISRGVIDLRDLYYYLSIFGVFLVLNLYSLESLRWSAKGREKQHMQWRVAAVLVAANMIAANFWLGQLGWARADLTQGNVYSISESSKSYLQQLQEPLLIRGYFSAETHPLLAPLVPRLRDLVKEYEVVGGGKVHVEFVDPMTEPKLEGEANSQYGIQPVPFQTTSKYQAAVTNSYFNLLVKYGNEFTTLGYQDLIEVKQQQGSDLAVDLRDPEYEITRAVKKVLSSYRGGGNVLSNIPQDVQLIAYVSEPKELPEPMPQLKTDLEALIKDYTASAPERFNSQTIDPGPPASDIAKELQTIGLQPLAVGLLDPQQFWFHILIRSGDKIEQVPLPESLDKDGLKRNIDATLKRFMPGALRTVAFHSPPAGPNPLAQLGMPGGDNPSFEYLQQKLRETATVEATDMNDGRVPEQADILFVAAPDDLGEKQLFAIDQFLMKGGTVVLATAPFTSSLSSRLKAAETKSGLTDWLASYGLSMENGLVLDQQSMPFPIPVERNVGGFQVQEIQRVPYPYFIDVRDDGLQSSEAPTLGLKQITMPWASPIKVDTAKAKDRKVTPLIESSPASWVATQPETVPDFEAFPEYGFEERQEKSRHLLGVMMEGKFNSFFAGKPSPLASDAKPDEAKENAAEAEPAQSAPDANADEAKKKEAQPTITSVIEHSPESARIILIASNNFMSDEMINIASSIDRTQYLAPVNLAQNIVDWSLEDRGILALRSRGGQFSRTLEPMTASTQAMWEYVNYGLVLLGLALVYLIRRALRQSTRRKYMSILGIEGA